MAALLVALGVMSVMLTMAMPVWKRESQREKETELVFRLQQYARAFTLFQRRAGPGAMPPNLDVLVQQRFLRRKYKDPITGEDFQPIFAATGPESGVGRGGAGSAPAPGTSGGIGAPGAGITGAAGGLIGVVSKSKAKSIRVLAGRSVYNEWTSMLVAPQQAAVASPDGGRGGRGAGGDPAGRGGFGNSGIGAGRGRGGSSGSGGVGQPGQGRSGFPSSPPPSAPPRR